MTLEKYNHQFMLTPAIGVVKEDYTEPDHGGQHVLIVIAWLNFGLILRWFDIIKTNKL